MFVAVVAAAAAAVTGMGCASSNDNGRTTRVENRPMTANDTPFGGGFAPSQRPDDDPFGRVGTRNQVRIQSGADNGAPQTRGGGNGDARLSR
jgi:hypothetical protein